MAILGIDEVGRGPWAGPLVIGAVILPDEKPEWVAELNDSKKLTAKKREKLNEIILKEAPATGLGWVMPKELDKIGLSAALKLAARRAVEEVQKKKVPFTEIIIDGTINFLQGTKLENYVSVLPKADFLIKEVSAASIIAKVARDNYMTNLAEKYPQYGFEKHVGYGTAAHKKALEEFGPCPEHRFSFKPVAQLCPPASVFEKLPDSEEYKRSAAGVEMPEGISTPRVTLEESGNFSKTRIGAIAEEKVAEMLKHKGHKIIARNHKTKFYEIDIISTKGNKVYFTEVKYRKTKTHGTPLEMITKQKQDQMKFAAESYLKFNKNLTNYSPTLAAAAVSGEDFEIETWFEIN